MNYFDVHYKETSPIETYNKLSKILAVNNITVKEQWMNESEAGTYSLRLTVENSHTIGSNGKGVDKAYARASAYAELFERLQNTLLLPKQFLEKAPFDFYECPDECYLSASDLLHQNNSFISLYKKEMGFNDLKNDAIAEEMTKLHNIAIKHHNSSNKFLCIPFYSVSEKKVVNMPYVIYYSIYGSNGMCAGNTDYEALVQGYSEIIERFVQKKLFMEKPVLPNIPQEYIKKYPDVWHMYNKMKQLKGFEVSLKDCSFGGKYPVAALLIIEKDTGRYGLKLGCHPNYGIAMERAITEAAQGNNIVDYVNRSTLDFSNFNVDTEQNIYNSFKLGLAQYPYQLFGSQATFDFVPCNDTINMSNAVLFKNMTQSFISNGYDVLIRNVSYLGFPSFQIIIPGMSEMQKISPATYRRINTREFVSSLMMNTSLIDRSNCKYIIASLNQYIGSLLDNTLSSYYKGFEKLPLPLEDFGLGNHYFLALAYSFINDYKSAAIEMRGIIKNLDALENVECTDKAFYKVQYHYYVALSFGVSHSDAINILYCFFSKPVVDRIKELYEDSSKLFTSLYPDISMSAYLYNEPTKIIMKCYNIVKEHMVTHPINQCNISKTLKLS